MDERGDNPGAADLRARAEALRAQGDEEGAQALEALCSLPGYPGPLPINPARPLRTVLMIAAHKATASEVWCQVEEGDKQRIPPGELE